MDNSTSERRPDWTALERSADFRELAATRRRFVVPALMVFAFWFGGFLVLTAYARDFMGTKVIGNFTWAWVLALSLILMTWIIVALYLRWADRRLTRLVERVVRAGEES